MNFELTDQQRMFQKLARDFADREIEPIADDIDRQGVIPPDMLGKMAKVGLLGITASEKYGGLEQGFLTLILMLEQIHYPCSACSYLFLQCASVGLPEAHGTEEQKEEYIPRVIRGELIPSLAFTEPATGSDPRMLTTIAHLENGYWVINGTKRFCSWGHRDGPNTVCCKTDGDGISAILVPKNMPGYACSKPYGLLGIRGLETVDVYLRDVRVPEKNLIGERGNAHVMLLEGAGGARLLMSIMSVACGQRALDEAVEYAKQRTTRRGPVSDMQGHRWLLADMASRIEAARWLTYRASFLSQQGKEVRKEAAMAKLFAGQTGEWVASQAMQVHGAYGYTVEYSIERIYRAAKVQEVIEGPNEVQRSIVGGALVRE